MTTVRLLKAGPALSLMLALPLLRVAARYDRHWRSDTSGLVDHRVGAGLFLLCGCLAAAPAIAKAVFGRGRRMGAVCVTIVIMVLAVLCETVVSVAPEPWFTF